LDKGLELLNRLLTANSEDVRALLMMGDIYLHKEDTAAARRMYQKAILIQPENEKNWSKIYDHIAFSHNNSVSSEFLESFTGYYRFEDGEISIAFYEHNNHLVGQAKNQYSEFNYPVSNTKFTSVNGAASFTFVKNNQGRVIKTFLDQYGELLVAWKEDSLIFNAMELLDGKDRAKALDAFREAYIHNPDHYYLANFIQHLEFIQSKEIERISPVLETYNGTYGNMTIFFKNNIYYYKDYRGYLFKLLPLSESQFMIPSFYNRIFRIVMKNNLINGLEVIYRDGRKEFFPRIN
jgi:tetratricopeptide (TPR) repeat protein